MNQQYGFPYNMCIFMRSSGKILVKKTYIIRELKIDKYKVVGPIPIA